MNADWVVESRRLLLERAPWFSVYEESVRLPNGTAVDDFYTISIPDYVVVAAFDHRGRVVAERHYRHGARAVTWSLPSGYVEPGEAADHAARRELREETGYEAETCDLIGRFVADGNRGCGWANIYLARGLRQVEAPHDNDLGYTAVQLIPYQQMEVSLIRGRMHELASAVALLLAGLDCRLKQGGSRIGLEH